MVKKANMKLKNDGEKGSFFLYFKMVVGSGLQAQGHIHMTKYVLRPCFNKLYEIDEKHKAQPSNVSSMQLLESVPHSVPFFSLCNCVWS